MQQVQVRHIQVDSLEVARFVEGQLKAGLDFVDLARLHSTCPSGQRGGELEWFEIENSFLSKAHLEDGSIIGPIQSDFGYHIVEILGISYQETTQRVS